ATARGNVTESNGTPSIAIAKAVGDESNRRRCGEMDSVRAEEGRLTESSAKAGLNATGFGSTTQAKNILLRRGSRSCPSRRARVTKSTLSRGVLTYSPFAVFNPITPLVLRLTVGGVAKKCSRMKRERTQPTAYPLSPMQQGMLFHALAAPRTGVNIEQIILTLPEALDVATLERAWQCVAAHHEMLHTAFRWNGSGQPLQEPQADAAIPFHCEVRRSLAALEQEVALDAWLRAD